MRHVQLEQVEAGLVAPCAAARTKSSRTASMSARSISRGTWLCGQYGSGDGGDDRPVAVGAAARRSPSHSRLRRALAARRAPSWMPIFAGLVRVHEVDDALPGRHVLGLVHAGAAGRDAALAADVGHLGRSPGRRRRPRGCRGARGASRSACRPRPSTGTSARRRRGSRARSSRRRNGVNIGGGGGVAGDADAALPRGLLGEPARRPRRRASGRARLRFS